MENHYRSLIKAVSYRIFGSAATALVVLLVTGKLLLSLGTGALDMVTKIGLYYAHERAWERISFGRNTVREFEA